MGLKLGAAATALLAFGGLARAADLPAAAPAEVVEAAASAFDYTFAFTGLSDYVFRGISQTSEDPAAQPFAEVRYDIAYANIFASNVDFNAPDPDVEIDLSAGLRPTIGGIAFDFGVIGYVYDDSDIDYVEGLAAASYTFFEKLTLGAKVFASPDFLNLDDYGVYTEGTASYTLLEGLSVGGAIGAQFVGEDAGLEDYVTGNVGLSYKAFNAITFDVRYHDTSLDGDECTAYSGIRSGCDERIVGSIKLELIGSQINKPKS